MEKIGFIGMGVMGRPMAKNMVKAGYSLTVFDTRADAVAELEALGAKGAQSCEEVARNSDVVILMVSDSSQVKDVIFGPAGVAKGIRSGGTVIIMSTIEPTVCKSAAEELTKQGVHTLDAPVYRGAGAAEAGTLGILVGGDEKVSDACREILKSMGSDVFYCGPIGTGELVKIVNNFIIINTTLLLAEAMTTGVKYGMDPTRLVELLKAGSANSWILGYWSDMVLNRKFSPPLFNFDMALKDTGLALTTAKELNVPMPIGSACYQLFQLAGANGRNKLDYTAVVTLFEEMTGVEVKAKAA